MIPPQLLVHTASVTPYAGTGAYGDTFGDAISVPCYFEGKRQVVRGPDGDEAISEGVLYADLGYDIPVGSKVSVAGRDSIALAVSTFDDAGLTGLAHIEVALT